MATEPLAGRVVLVTRPEPQNGILAARLEAQGARALRTPLLDIAPLPLGEAERSLLAQAVDGLVFVSGTAVQHYLAALAACGLAQPIDCPVFAVGQATAAALRQAGFARVEAAPEGAESSEGLLALPALKDLLAGRLCLVRGRGGREALAEAVAAVGGELALLELYERRPLAYEASALLAHWRAAGLREILVTSGESLDTLHELAGPDWAWLKTLNWYVPGPRLAARAAALGCGRVIEAGGAGDEVMLQALRRSDEG
ncbi:MAG: uroporphyrinogen-III synthase [Gammaproteobacteria bacterium]|nr:uroporphyrinogen-III synthase [Gammaproteobacteria bacterium]